MGPAGTGLAEGPGQETAVHLRVQGKAALSNFFEGSILQVT